MQAVWYVAFYGVLASVAAVICLGWGLTATTVSAQIVDCGPPRVEGHGEADL